MLTLLVKQDGYVGVQKKDICPKDFTIDLTPEVKAAIPYAVDAVLELLEIGLEV